LSKGGNLSPLFVEKGQYFSSLWQREAGLPARSRSRRLLIEICLQCDSKLGIEIGWVPGEGRVILGLSSRNMHIDNPATVVKIPLANRHQYGK